MPLEPFRIAGFEPAYDSLIDYLEYLQVVLFAVLHHIRQYDFTVNDLVCQDVSSHARSYLNREAINDDIFFIGLVNSI